MKTPHMLSAATENTALVNMHQSFTMFLQCFSVSNVSVTSRQCLLRAVVVLFPRLFLMFCTIQQVTTLEI